jgi:hypothetical protein
LRGEPVLISSNFGAEANTLDYFALCVVSKINAGLFFLGLKTFEDGDGGKKV